MSPLMAKPLGREEWEQLRVLARATVHDAQILSKNGRDLLVQRGFVARMEGWNFITPQGVRHAHLWGILKT